MADGGMEAHADKEATNGEELLTTVDPQERSIWRSGVRSASLCVQLRGPTDVNDVRSYYLCGEGIEKSVPRDHSLSSLVMPIGAPRTDFSIPPSHS